MIKPTVRFLATLLCLAALICLFPACKQSANVLAPNGISSLLLNAKTKTVTATVSVSEKSLQEHAGENLRLFEVLPGGTLKGCLSDTPIATQRISASSKITFNLFDGQRSRLYSSFVIAFEDGSFLSEQPKRIQNPQVMANETYRFTWASSIKGLSGTDAEQTGALGAMHVMYELSLADLAKGSDTFAFGGTSYRYSKAALTKLDGQIKAATEAGLQVSLLLIPDYIPSAMQATAFFDLLASHYAGGVCGTVSAFFIGASPALNPTQAAQFAALANYALLSRVSNGRVYVVSDADTLSEAKAFFSDVKNSIERNGAFEWGAAVSPVPSDNPWEAPTANEFGELPLTVSTLSSLSTHLFSAGKSGQASRLAVVSLSCSAEDPDRQAAVLAYSYRAAFAAKVDTVFYAAHTDEAFGLYATDGSPRRAAEVFRTVDSELSEDNERLLSSFAQDAWKQLKLSAKTTHLLKRGGATLGDSGYDDDVWFSFADGDTHSFEGIGSLTDPKCHSSAALGTQVLYTWMDPTAEGDVGLRRLFPRAEVLRDTRSLTLKLLTQVPNADTCRIRLQLRGTATRGSLLTHVSEITLENGVWQTATFQISEFVANADLSEPCILTITCEPDQPTDEEYVLWLHSIRARRPDENKGQLLPLALILGGALLGFAGVLVIHFGLQKRPRRKGRRATSPHRPSGA